MYILIRSLILLLIVKSSLASDFQVNDEHSKIQFSIKYMSISDVEGRFNDYKIFFEMNETKISKLKAVIEANSIDTFDKKRDSHLRKSDFFWVKKYPTIEIWSDQEFIINKDKVSAVDLNIRIKNKQQRAKFYITYKGKRDDPITKKTGHYFSLSSKINRKNFDITWNKKIDNGSLLLSDEVKIYGEFEAYEVGNKPAFSRFFTPSKDDIERVEIEEKKRTQKEKTPEETQQIVHKDSKQSNQDQGEIFTIKNLTVTFITGSVIFILMIALSYYGQKFMIEQLEARGVGEKPAYLISNTIIMIMIILLAIITAPFMGLGPNPLTTWF